MIYIDVNTIATIKLYLTKGTKNYLLMIAERYQILYPPSFLKNENIKYFLLTSQFGVFHVKDVKKCFVQIIIIVCTFTPY